MTKHATPIRSKPQQMVMGFFMPATADTPKATPVRASTIPEMKQWFRIDEVAEIFAVSQTQVRNWIDAGIVDARAIGVDFETAKKRCVRITRSSVVALLNNDSRKVT